MVDRLRALLERPLDPAFARAALVLACALTVGLAALVALGVPGPGQVARRSSRPAAELPVGAAGSTQSAGGRGGTGRHSEQDPQDQPGSAAHRRAERELASHRALQHVPYGRGGVVIDLVGAHDGRAVLRVRAATLAAARRGWRAFLGRFQDPGASYLLRFQAKGRSR